MQMFSNSQYLIYFFTSKFYVDFFTKIYNYYLNGKNLMEMVV